jgi:hypothetical protein
MHRRNNGWFAESLAYLLRVDGFVLEVASQTTMIKER